MVIRSNLTSAHQNGGKDGEHPRGFVAELVCGLSAAKTPLTRPRTSRTLSLRERAGIKNWTGTLAPRERVGIKNWAQECVTHFIHPPLARALGEAPPAPGPWQPPTI